MRYLYYNNGLSMRSVDGSYQVQAGEIIFNDVPTAEQLSEIFPTRMDYINAEKNIVTARDLLAQSDRVILRSIENGVILGKDNAWHSYRKELREFLKSPLGKNLPEKPDYPEES